MKKKQIPTHDPHTGELNPYYKDLTGEKNPLESDIVEKPSSSSLRHVLKDIYVEEGTPDEYFTLLKENNIPVNISEADSLAYQAANKKYETKDNKVAIEGFQNYLKKYPKGAYLNDANYYLD